MTTPNSLGKRQYSVIALLLIMLLMVVACTDSSGSSSNLSPTATTGSSINQTNGTASSTQAATAGVTSTEPTTADATSTSDNNSSSNQSSSTTNASTQGYPEQQAIIDVVNRTRPAVVTVVNKLSRNQGGFGGEALGTGMIVDNQGHIFTNDHVITGAAPGGLSVIFSNGDNVPATLVATDDVSDLAVLKIDRPITATVKLGNSDQLQVGQMVIAIGSALGDFQNTVTVGVVSGLNRSLPGAVGADIEPMIQTDAAINHGNSGGPLLDLNGNVIGMNTAIIRDTSATNSTTDIAEGLGFAIPVNTVSLVTSQLLTIGNVPRPYLGVATQQISPQISAYYDLRDSNGKLLASGELVIQVGQGSPADGAGIQPGDVITSVDNTAIDDAHPLTNLLLTHKPNDQVTLVLVRDGKEMSVKVNLGTRPAPNNAQPSTPVTP